MFGLKQRSTYEEIIKHVKSQEEQRVSLPSRISSIIHNSIKYQSFINEHLNDLEEQQNKAFKHNILQNEMSRLSLDLPDFPVFENPLMPIMQDTPLTPTSLNLPGVNAEAVAAQVQGGNFSALTNKQKFDLLFPNG